MRSLLLGEDNVDGDAEGAPLFHLQHRELGILDTLTNIDRTTVEHRGRLLVQPLVHASHQSYEYGH